MGITVLGLLLTDFNFIMVALFPNRIPGGYWFLTVGPAVEGSLGGESFVTWFDRLAQTTLCRCDQRHCGHARVFGGHY